MKVARTVLRALGGKVSALLTTRPHLTLCLTRKMIINDDLGAFMKVPTAMGNRAARLIDQLFFSRLLSNPA